MHQRVYILGVPLYASYSRLYWGGIPENHGMEPGGLEWSQGVWNGARGSVIEPGGLEWSQGVSSMTTYIDM